MSDYLIAFIVFAIIVGAGAFAQSRAKAILPPGEINELSALKPVPIYTTETIQGQEISEALGLITSIGYSWFWTSRSRIFDAESTAISNLRIKAKNIGADAVVAAKFSTSSVKGFWGITLWSNTAVVHISGTAVRIKKENIK